MILFRWTGLGILAAVFMVTGICLGGGAGLVLLSDLARDDTGKIVNNGVPLGGAVVGIVIAGVVTYLLGTALNVRRGPDGRRVRTDRHTVWGLPMEDMGRRTAILGVVLLPVAAVGFLPAGAVWALLGGWLVAVIVALRLLRRRRAGRSVRPRT